MTTDTGVYPYRPSTARIIALGTAALVGLLLFATGVALFSVLSFVLIIGEDALPALGVTFGAVANLMLLTVIMQVIEAFVRIRSTVIDDSGVQQIRWFKTRTLDWHAIKQIERTSAGTLLLRSHSDHVIITTSTFSKSADVLAFIKHRAP
jgi:hypothetical protein